MTDPPPGSTSNGSSRTSLPETLVSAVADPPPTSNGSSQTSPSQALTTLGCTVALSNDPRAQRTLPTPLSVQASSGGPWCSRSCGSGTCNSFNHPLNRPDGSQFISYSGADGDPEFGGCVFTPINEWSGLAVDDAGFGCGASTMFVDPWSGPDGVGSDDGGGADDSPGSFSFPHVFKYSSHSKSKSLARFPHTVTASSGMCTTPTDA